ncbi:MAG: hypothetical protein DWP98_02495 [Bacteroidetes bacterium]|nr:MAG: hypothetical protein DWP98_02495 [Bacteroidota bacterium]MBL1145667.1 hypothetical protein [Bacteroidota bacterium]MCB0803818.1 YdeI/OmpD-associated family protein [Flavobacteriales bacterium]NOG58461.1 hypothetical protein [Bacteroidota bacterium]
MKKSFIGEVTLHNSNLWGGHIKVPYEIAQFYSQKKVKRFICLLQKEIKINCAILSDGKGPFILINKEINKKLKKNIDETVLVELSPDDSKYGMEMPIEFEQCLMEDEAAYKFFENLSPGKQRNLIHLVLKIKNSDIRIRRSLSIIEHLNREQGELDFVKLNEVIKEFNQRFKIN